MAAVGQPWPFYRPERFSNGLQALVGAGGWEGEGGGGGEERRRGGLGGGVGWGAGFCSFWGLGALLGQPLGPTKKKRQSSCANFSAL